MQIGEIKSISQQPNVFMSMDVSRELHATNSSGYLLYSRFASAYVGYKTFTNSLNMFCCLLQEIILNEEIKLDIIFIHSFMLDIAMVKYFIYVPISIF